MRLSMHTLLLVVLLFAWSGARVFADDFDDAERLYHAGALAEAEAVYARVPSADRNYAEALLRRGTICYVTGRPSLAVKFAKACLERKPTVGAYCLLAGAQFNLEQFDEAYDSAKKAVALDPKYAPAFTTLGMIYTAIKDWPDAAAAFQESLRLAPRDPDTWFMIGRGAFLRDDFPKAREAFETSLRLNSQQIRGYENLALTLDLLGQAGTADETYRQGIKVAQERRSPDPGIYIAYGRFLAKRERAAESLTRFRAAARVAPGNPEAHYELANQLFRMKEWAEAAREGETASRLGPSEYRIHYLLARVYTALGDERDAARHAQEAARLTDKRP